MAEFDFEQPVSMEKMRAFRLDRIDEQMRQDGIDCIITMRVDNVRYLTSFRPNSPNTTTSATPPSRPWGTTPGHWWPAATTTGP